jgi:hypothetical protein
MSKLIVLLLFVLNSCSFVDSKSTIYSKIGELKDKDYIDHLDSMGADYLSNEETKEIKLEPESVKFLEQIFERLVSNNELLFSREYKPKFHIVISKAPFIFSLPRAQFFISSGLMQKYLKSEELFIAALGAEVLKSERSIYEKKIMIPLGYYNSEKMIRLTSVKQETKYHVNEWNYIILKRAGFDPSAVLNWIQVQNRNTLDFSLLLGDSVGISKEEHFFKNYMTKQGVSGLEKKFNESNSSREFYKLLNNIARNK